MGDDLQCGKKLFKNKAPFCRFCKQMRRVQSAKVYKNSVVFSIQRNCKNVEWAAKYKKWYERGENAPVAQKYSVQCDKAMQKVL